MLLRALMNSIIAIIGLHLIIKIPNLGATALEDFLSSEIRKSPLFVEALQNSKIANSEYINIRAQLMPQINTQWNYFKTDRSQDGFDSSLNLNAKQTLFAGGAEYKELKAASLLKDKSLADLNDAQDKLLANLLFQSIQWQIHNLKTEVLKKVQGTQENRINELSRRVRLGQSRQPDLLQAQIENSNLSRRLSDSELTKERIEEQIQVSLGYTEDELQHLLNIVNSNTPLQHLENTLAFRDDFRRKSLELENEMANLKSESIWLKTLPTLSTYGQKSIFSPQNTGNDWEVGLQAQWTLFEGFKTPAESEAAKAKKIITEKRLSVLKLEQDLSVKRLKNEQSRLSTISQSLKNDIDRAKKVLQQQEKDYRLGLATELEVQQTLQSVLNLELESLSFQENQAQLILQNYLKGENL